MLHIFHVSFIAPAGVNLGPTVTVYPDPTNGCPDLSSTLSIGTDSLSRYAHQLRWSFITDGGSAIDAKFLRKFNGKRSIQISSCTNAGLFIISRRRRGKRGWLDFIRVIVSRKLTLVVITLKLYIGKKE